MSAASENLRGRGFHNIADVVDYADNQFDDSLDPQKFEQWEELTVHHHNGLCLIVEEFSCWVLGRYVKLTVAEVHIMHLLMANPERFFTRSDILDWLERCSGSEYIEVYDRTVDSYIKRIRKKLLPKNANLAKTLIETRFGRGYRLADLRKGRQ